MKTTGTPDDPDPAYTGPPGHSDPYPAPPASPPAHRITGWSAVQLTLDRELYPEAYRRHYPRPVDDDDSPVGDR